jgi:hypothetical protein
MTAKSENLSLLKWIQDQGSNGTDRYFEYIFSIGDKLEFQIRVKGGQFGGSEPDEMLANLADYDNLNVQIFECPRAESRSLDNLNIWRMEAIPIHPDIDERFSSQPWVKDWCVNKSLTGKSSLVSFQIAPPDTVCDIVRYCQKIVGLKAFW